MSSLIDAILKEGIVRKGVAFANEDGTTCTEQDVVRIGVDDLEQLIEAHTLSIVESIKADVDNLYEPSEHDIYLRERAGEPSRVVYLDQVTTLLKNLKERQ